MSHYKLLPLTIFQGNGGVNFVDVKEDALISYLVLRDQGNF